MYFISMLRPKFQELLSVFRAQGLRAGLAAFGRFVVRRFYDHREFLVFIYPVPRDAYLPVLNPALEIREVADSREFEKIESKTEEENDIIRFHRMFELGSICLFALLNKEVAGYTWISKNDNIDANRIQPPLGSGEVLLHDLFVLPEYRRHGVAEALMDYCSYYLSNTGCLRGVCGVDLGNVRSINLVLKLGYQPAGAMVYRRFLFWHQVSKKPEAKRGT